MKDMQSMNGFAPYSLNVGGRLIEFDRPVTMGIINVTPDSFFASSRTAPELVAQRAMRMVAEGAAIIDIGGCSTRPGFEAPDPDEEKARVLPAIGAVREACPDVLISVDTYRAEVAREAIGAGADIVNDVGMPSEREAMNRALADMRVPYVLTHSDSLEGVALENVATAVCLGLQKRLRELTLAGVSDVIVDPGFGFGKTLDQNYALLRDMALLQSLGCPILVGISRKSMICRELGIEAAEALNGTTALHAVALERGAAILRAHDVEAAAQTIALIGKLSTPSISSLK